MELKCPYCGKEFNRKAWGFHTMECPENPKNKKTVKIAVKDATQEKKAKAKRKK